MIETVSGNCLPSNFRVSIRCLAVLSGIWPLSVPSTCGGQVDPPEAAAVAATVNGAVISVREVEFELSRATSGGELDSAAAPYFKARTLQQLIDRELVLQWLQAKNQAAADTEVALAIGRLEQRLAQREMTLQEHLDAKKLGPVELERVLRWQLSWPRFLQRFMTDDNLARYFHDHLADFDGRQVRVAHLLLAVGPDLSEPLRSAEVARQRTAAEEIRRQVVAGEQSFAAATREHSAAPTAAEGGEIGFISRHDPMPEPFSAAAFRLSPGEISPPVESRFGVHLIRCQEIKPGQNKWTDVRGALEVAVKQYLFDWAASQARAGARVELNAGFPHFRPGTSELAE